MVVNVLIFDDNSSRRDSLKTLIGMVDGFACVGTYNDGRDVLKIIENTNPNVVLMDIDMPYVNGIEAVKKIKTKYPNLKILMQTVFEDEDKVFQSICAGADGYILKQTHPMKLMDGIKDVLHGGAPITPSIAKKILQEFSNKTTSSNTKKFDLTKRELEILNLLVKGYSYKKIADECFVSYSTVNTHITKIYKKLQVDSATSAVSKAINEGLI